MEDIKLFAIEQKLPVFSYYFSGTRDEFFDDYWRVLSLDDMTDLISKMSTSITMIAEQLYFGGLLLDIRKLDSVRLTPTKLLFEITGCEQTGAFEVSSPQLLIFLYNLFKHFPLSRNVSV